MRSVRAIRPPTVTGRRPGFNRAEGRNKTSTVSAGFPGEHAIGRFGANPEVVALDAESGPGSSPLDVGAGARNGALLVFRARVDASGARQTNGGVQQRSSRLKLSGSVSRQKGGAP